MADTATLTIRVNGGAPETGGIYADDLDTIQLGAVSKSGWPTDIVRWEIYDYPEAFACPAGWETDTDDDTRPTYFVRGASDPPAFDLDGWGAYKTRLVVPITGLPTDEATFIKVLSPNGLEDEAAGETSQFGGTKLETAKAYHANLQLVEDFLAASAIPSSHSAVSPPPVIAAASALGAIVDRHALEDHTHGHDGTTTATADKLALRGALGVCSFGALTAPSLTSTVLAVSASAGTLDLQATGDLQLSATGLVDAQGGSISMVATTTFDAAASGALTLEGASAELKSTTGAIDIDSKTGIVNLQKDGATALVVTVDSAGAFSVAPVAGSTSVTYQQAQATAGIGVNAIFAAQRGFAGSVGGVSVLGASNGGTPGTQLAGGVALELGQLVSNVSAKAAFWANGSEVGYAQKLTATEFALASAAAHDLSLEAATGSLRMKVGGSDSVVWTLSASGAVTLAPVGGAASLTIQPSQKTSGAGAAVTIAGGQGSSGNVGGKSTIGANNGATPGTNLAGGVDVQLGATVTAASAPLTVLSDATTVVAISKSASASADFTCPGLLYMHGASGCLIGSNDDSVRVECQQSTGIVTAKGTNGGVRLQDTSVTWIELARVAVGRNVVGLCVGANLDTTKMPANTGNGVVFVGNASSAPTASSNNTGTIVYSESSQLKARDSAGVVSDLSLQDISNTSATKKQRLYYEALVVTTAVTTTTLSTIKQSQHSGTGAGIAYVRITGYDTVADRVDASERSIRYRVTAGTMAIVSTRTIGTDDGAHTITVDVSTDVRIRVDAANANNTRWTIEVDDIYTEH